LPSVKESSDDLNPPVVIAGSENVRPRKVRTPGDYVALAIATCGVGYMPIAPGTWGSVVGVGIYVLLRQASLGLFQRFDPKGSGLPIENLFISLELITILLITLIGIWAASRVERMEQKKDPGKVVIDEVAGQLIALLPIGLTLTWSWRVWVIVGFFLFRGFDIVKPYPVRRLESLESGLGIVTDDLAAGAYAAVSVSVLITIFTFR
jgi:phosphatidylglycerophosphatase A